MIATCKKTTWTCPMCGYVLIIELGGKSSSVLIMGFQKFSEALEWGSTYHPMSSVPNILIGTAVPVC